MVRTLAIESLRPAAREADEREAIPQSVLDEIWATGIIQSQADSTSDSSGRSCTLNALLLEELGVADAAFAFAAAAPIISERGRFPGFRRAKENFAAAL